MFASSREKNIACYSHFIHSTVFSVDESYFYTVKTVGINLLHSLCGYVQSLTLLSCRIGVFLLFRKKIKGFFIMLLILHSMCCSFWISSSVSDSYLGNEKWLAISASLTCFLSKFFSIHQQNHIIRGQWEASPDGLCYNREPLLLQL